MLMSVHPCLRRSASTRAASYDAIAVQVMHALCRLGHVRRLENLGAQGPLDASAGRDSAFACLFGRDSLRMALDLLDDFPAVARATIRKLTALQGVDQNSRSEEEPGRILHEHRRAHDMTTAHVCRAWDFPYYGAVDTTPLYVVLIGAFCRRHGIRILHERVRARDGRQITIAAGLARALQWIERRVARDGYVCVRRSQPHGIQHQFWEDSYDSQFHADGRLLAPAIPYAPIAVQGYTYDALIVAARIEQDRDLAARWAEIASHLRRRVLADFWLADLETFAPAVVLDSSPPGPLRIVASSPGHLLAGRLLDGEDAAAYRNALVRRLLAPDMLASAGVRTKSTTAARFAPGSYHNGSVWPVDTGVLADGLRRHGYVHEANDLEERILAACAEVGSPVEFLRGDAIAGVRINTQVLDELEDGVVRRREQPPQRVQGWTVTRLWRILRRRGLLAAASERHTMREQESGSHAVSRPSAA
jgi:glycogen debranching enzyme